MTLYHYMVKKGWSESTDELTVWDRDVDIETYFFLKEAEKPDGKWEETMMQLAKKLTIIEESDNGVVVDLYDLIDRNIDTINKTELFCNELDAEDIMDDIEGILAGNVSEKWFTDFVDCLKA